MLVACGESAPEPVPTMDAGVPDVGAPDAGVFTPTPRLSETLPASPGATPVPTVIGSAELGAVVRVFQGEACEGTPIATLDSAGAFAVEVRVELGETAFVADAELPGLMRSACSEPLRYVFDPDAADRPVLLRTDPASPSTEPMPTVLGSAAPGLQVAVHLGGDCSGDPLATGVADDLGEFALPVPAPLGDSVLTARTSSASGERSPCSLPLSYRRFRDALPVFPPAPALTTRARLRLRARIDVLSLATVDFRGPAGSVTATYDAASDTFSATVPLVEGPQRITAEFGEGPVDVFEVTRGVVPINPRSLGFDADSGEVLLGDGGRVLAADAETGGVRLVSDFSERLVNVQAVLRHRGTLYVVGVADTGDIELLRDTGSGPTFVQTLEPGFAPITLDARPGELIVGPSGDALLFIDDTSFEVRSVALERRLCNAVYLPASDEVLVCPGVGVDAPGYELIDGETLARRAPGGLGEDIRFAIELRYDARAGRPLARSQLGELYELDIVENTARVVAAIPPVQAMTVRPTDGLVLAVPRTTVTTDVALLSVDRDRGVSELIPLATVGTGDPLTNVIAVAASGADVFLSDGSRGLQLALGEGGGARRTVAASGTGTWTSMAFDPAGRDLFVSLLDGSILRYSLATDDITTLRSASGFRATYDLTVGGGFVVDVGSNRDTVAVRSLDALESSGALAEIEHPEDVTLTLEAVAIDEASDEAVVAVRDTFLDRLPEIRLTRLGLRGAEERPVPLFRTDRVAVLGRFAEVDVAVSGGTAFLGMGTTLWAIELATGALRWEVTLPGSIQEVAAPGEDDVGYAVTTAAPGLLAFDGQTGEHAFVAR